MSDTTTDTTTDDTDAAERRARASIAFGRKRGYYRVLFDAGPVDAATFAALAAVPEHGARVWLGEQLAAGILRTVPTPQGEELLLPGEYVTALIGDHGEPELAGARALEVEHRAELPALLARLPEPSSREIAAEAATARGLAFESASAQADRVRLMRVL